MIRPARIRLLPRLCLVIACTLCASCATADVASSWSGVERIVAVGDVHGDYSQFRRVLLDAALIDRKDRWIGGRTHLVQVGDVPDRGPDTRKAMDLLMKLERQARRKGGYVHALIGNHEAMNILGDLRYVHPGEYEAFVDRRSLARQTSLFEATVARIQSTRPQEEWPVFDAAFEQDFRERYPLGYVEHRRAWLPEDGKYGRWVARHNTVIRVNDTLFLHGGLSGKYAALSLDEMNQRVREELSSPSPPGEQSLVNDELGPLWYRGLALGDDEEEAAQALVGQILQARNARRIVIAHTPLTGAIVPRFDSRVIEVDVGLAAYYGARVACLVIEGEDVYALHRGTRLDLPADDAGLEAYLERAAALDPSPSPILEYIELLKRPAEAVEQEPDQPQASDQAAAGG